MTDLITENLSGQQENGSNRIFENSIQKADILEKSVSSKKIRNTIPDFLQKTSREAAPFPFDALGDILGPAASKVFEIVQAPDSICGSSFLAASCLAVQPHADINVDGRQFPISLFFLSIAESGDRKSAVDSIALDAIKKHQKKIYDTYAGDQQQFRNNYDTWNKKRQALLNKRDDDNLDEELKMIGEEPNPPLKPLILMEEPTYEGLIKLLDMGQPSVGLFSDEGGKMFGGYGMDKNNLLKTSCGLSSLWDGKSASRVRGGEDFILVYGKRLSLHLMIQEIILTNVLSNPILTTQGLLARCLMVFPPSMVGKREYQETNPFDDPAVSRFLEQSSRILEIPFITEGKNKNILLPRLLGLHPAAKKQWILFHNDLEKLIATDDYFSVRRTASKTPEQALRIAGDLALFSDPNASSLTIDNLDRGIELAKFYLHECLRILNTQATNPDLTQARLTFEWLKREFEKGQSLIPLCDLYQRGPNNIREASQARKIMKILEDHDLVTFHPNEMINGIRRKEVWSINEACLETC